MDHTESTSATVLVVDDEECIRRITKRGLVMKGFNVLEADCGEDALSIINSTESHIDVLLTDLRLPGMQGRDLGSEFSRSYPDSSVIYMTGSAPQDIQGDCNCTMVAHKPFCICELSDTISGIIASGSKPSSSFLLGLAHT